MSLWFVYLYVCFNLRDISYKEEALGEAGTEELCFVEDCSHKSDKEEGSTKEGVSASTEALLLGQKRAQDVSSVWCWTGSGSVLIRCWSQSWSGDGNVLWLTGSWVVFPDVSIVPPSFLFALRSPATS